jgi:hypothetical protein
MAMASTILLSPATLLKYAGLLQHGYEEIGVHVQNLVAPQSAVSNSSDFAGFASKVEAKAAAAGPARVLAQLHGSHEEVHILDILSNIDHSKLSITILLHRPEEISKRVEMNSYSSKTNDLLRSSQTRLVVLGEAGLSFFPSAVVIPHGFSRVDISPSTGGHDTTNVLPGDVAVLGSMTTWGDMRWIRDVMVFQEAMLSRRAGSSSNSSQPSRHDLLFVVGGRFVSYELDDGTMYDERRQVIKDCKDHVVVIDKKRVLAYGEEEGEEGKGGAALFENQSEFRRWLYETCDRGRKLCILDPSVFEVESVAALRSCLIDFNFQLYREFLNHFLPKVEYSGTLHEAPGSSIPVVFESASMTDVEQEGLRMMYVPPPKPDEVVDQQSLFNVIEGIETMLSEGGRREGAFEEWCRRNRESGKNWRFKRIAKMYNTS